MRAYLVDDEPLALKRLARMLEETGRVAVDGSSSDPAQALAQYGPRIIGQVDFDEGRVRASLSIDAAFSAIVLKTRRTEVRFQANVVNLTDRLNVINFAGLFSGTALAPPRSVGVRLQCDF